MAYSYRELKSGSRSSEGRSIRGKLQAAADFRVDSIHDDRADLEPKPFELWPDGDVERTGRHDRFDPAQRDRKLREWNHRPGYGGCECERGRDPDENGPAGRLRLTDRLLQRGRTERQKHIGSGNAGGESSEDRGVAHVSTKAVALGQVGEIHCHINQHRRNAEGHGDVQLGRDDLGHSNYRQHRGSDILDDEIARGLGCSYRDLRGDGRLFRCNGVGNAGRQRHDDRADIEPQPVELWPGGDVERTGGHDRFDPAHRDRNLQEWNHRPGYGGCECERGCNADENEPAARLRLTGRLLQRGRAECQKHIGGGNAGGESGEDRDVAPVSTKSGKSVRFSAPFSYNGTTLGTEIWRPGDRLPHSLAAPSMRPG